MTYAFVFVNFAMEEGVESLDIPKVFLHKKDAMKEFEKRQDSVEDYTRSNVVEDIHTLL